MALWGVGVKPPNCGGRCDSVPEKKEIKKDVKKEEHKIDKK